jgi:hypothetical protein
MTSGFRAKIPIGGWPLRAITGHPPTAWRTGEFDPLLPHKIGRMNGRKREKADFG